MKQTSIELNIFPVYETVEVIRLVVPADMIKIKFGKKDDIILESHSKAIELIAKHYAESTFYYSGGHISFFRNDQFVFPKGHAYKIEKLGTDNRMVRIIIFRHRYTGDVDSRKVNNECCDFPFEFNSYTIANIDGVEIKW